MFTAGLSLILWSFCFYLSHMKKGLIIAAVILVIVGGFIFWCMGAYNGMVTEEEKVDSQWANVENQYQRRADLIPNLVSTVKGYATHESATLEGVVAARAKATSTTIDVSNLDEASLARYQAAQWELSQALGRQIGRAHV